MITLLKALVVQREIKHLLGRKRILILTNPSLNPLGLHRSISNDSEYAPVLV